MNSVGDNLGEDRRSGVLSVGRHTKRIRLVIGRRYGKALRLSQIRVVQHD